MVLERHTRGISHGCWHPLIFGTAAVAKQTEGGKVTDLEPGDGSVVNEDMKAEEWASSGEEDSRGKEEACECVLECPGKQRASEQRLRLY